MPRRRQLKARVNQKHLQTKQTLIHHKDPDPTEPAATPEDVTQPEGKDATETAGTESKEVTGKTPRSIARIIYSLIKY